MESAVSNSVGGFFNNLWKELKTGRLGIWGKWLGYLATLICFFSLFRFGRISFLNWIIALILILIVVALNWLPCFNCFSSIKNINQKLEAGRNPLIVGVIMLFTCWAFWGCSLFGAILIGLSGILYVAGSFFDKKNGNDAMV